MRNTAVFCVPVFLALNGCTSVPDLPEQYSVSVSDVVDNIRCELRDASHNHTMMTTGKGWTAAVDLELYVTANAGFDASASLTNPVRSTGVENQVVVSIGGGHSAKAERTANFSFAVNMLDPSKIHCDASVPADAHHLLRGNLGIDNWIGVLAMTFAQSKAGKEKRETALTPIKSGYTVEFTITTKGSLGPSIEAIGIGASQARAGLILSGDRGERHKMTIAFTPNADEDPQEVIIVGYKKKVTKKPNTNDIKRNLTDEINRTSGRLVQ